MRSEGRKISLYISQRYLWVTDNVGEETEPSQLVHGSLRRFCLLFAVYVRDHRDMDQREVLVTYSELELSHSFDKWRGLNITNSSAELRTNVNE